MNQEQNKILVVDDEPAIRELLKSMLERFNYQVIEASDGESAADIYLKEKDGIDMIILDLIMPGWSGKKTLKEIRKINPKAKILISSGYTTYEITQEIKKANITGYIKKPYTLKALLNAVKELMSQE